MIGISICLSLASNIDADVIVDNLKKIPLLWLQSVFWNIILGISVSGSQSVDSIEKHTHTES